MAATIDHNNRDIVYPVNDDNSLFNLNEDEVNYMVERLESSGLLFGLNVFEDSVLEEATNIKLPLNAEKDLRGLSYNERKTAINNVPHVNLWITPNIKRNEYDKYCICWVWIELPEEKDGIKYVPVIIHRTGGVSVHPYYHKYFLRAFDKRTRHLILGFCYVHTAEIASAVEFSAGKDEVREDDADDLRFCASRYKDSDAPKRIDQGPNPDDKFFKKSIEDYNRWKAEFK